MAIVADIHANAVAFGAVLAEVRMLRADVVICLGDLVGYNAEPVRSLEMVRDSCDAVVAGNHDVDVARGDAMPGTSTVARSVQQWTRDQLGQDDFAYLRSLPAILSNPQARFVAVHGCYLNSTHVNGYVTSTMLEANLRAVAEQHGDGTVAFCGHTHFPLISWLEGIAVVEIQADHEIRWPERARSVLINPGSVGQPRDGDRRASFGMVDFDRRAVEIHRVEYDVELAASLIVAAGLPVALADRLREGR